MSRILVAALVALAGCGASGEGPADANPPPAGPPGTPPPSGQSAQVEMRSTDDGYGYEVNSFVPGTVNVARNGSVSWVNQTGITHNVTFSATAGAPQNIGDHATGTNTRTFGTAGSFNYTCTQHPGMGGTVVVQ